MTDHEFELSPLPPTSSPDTRRGWGKPRFLEDRSTQLDAILGCPAISVPDDHLAREVIKMIDLLDLAPLERQYSSLGRRGLHPRHKLGVLVYGSLIGVHEASKLAALLKTDAACRLITGGHSISATGLRTFRRENVDFFAYAIEQTVALAAKRGLLSPTDLAVDSMRLRADASSKSIRTLSRSKKRLEELESVNAESLGETARVKHDEKLQKHRAAVERCEREKRTSHSTTNEMAGLMKFPGGASLPGHRITAVAAGVRLRFVIAVLIGAEPTDHDLLPPAMVKAEAALRAAGVTGKLQVAADGGYVGHEDLRFARDQREKVDVLINDPPVPRRGKSKREGGFFSRDEFEFTDNDRVICPAGKAMEGPFSAGPGKKKWHGVGCGSCPLRAQCTTAPRRKVAVDLERESLHQATRSRMAEPGAEERYRRRMATVEPVFSYIEDTMGFRRASSRNAATVHAEILLKILAYNLTRLALLEILEVAVVQGEWDTGNIRTHAVHITTPAALVAWWAGETGILAISYSC